MFSLWRLSLAIVLVSQSLLAQDPPRFAGPTETGFLLPNGWHITPVGTHIGLPDLPLNILPLADSRHALVACNGFNEHLLAVVDLAEARVVERQTAWQSWFGLATDRNATRVWWSGGGTGQLHTFTLSDHRLERTSPPDKDISRLSPEQIRKLEAEWEAQNGFRSGLCWDESRGVLYSLRINAGRLSAISVSDGAEKDVELGGRPYDVQLARGGHMLYVSDWARRQVLAVRCSDLQVVDRIPVGEHPNQIAIHPTDARLFVACASSNSVSVIDTKRGAVTETIGTGLFPRAPEGSTPQGDCAKLGNLG